MEEKAYAEDLKSLMGDGIQRYLLAQQYNNALEYGAATYQSNNILKDLDRVPRENRKFFLQFLFGSCPLLRIAKCAKCGHGFKFDREKSLKGRWNYETPQSAPAVHFLAKCPHFATERKKLVDKVYPNLLLHALPLGQLFKSSLEGDGVDASAILMGCNAFTYDETPFKIKKLYRRQGRPKHGEPHVAQQLRDIVRDTAAFIFHIFCDHAMADPPQANDLQT